MPAQSRKPSTKGPFKPLVIIHGGAGSITRPNLPPSLYEQYHASLKSYLQSTYAVLNGDDPSDQSSRSSHGQGEKHKTDTSNNAYNAVEAAAHAVSLLEDDPLFNCGHGSVFNTEGEVQMEASLAVSSIHPKIPTSLPGHVKKSAAVSMITQTRHPILLAKEILSMGDEDHSKGSDNESILGNVRSMHGHLSGEWVEQYGWSKGLEKKPKQWFWTRRRWDEHRRGLGLDHSDEAWKSKLESDRSQLSTCLDTSTSTSTDDTTSCRSGSPSEQASAHDLPSQGTVGAVCLDSWGNLAVATSTGGLTNKRPGRIGDTPTVGSGFWAESWDETVNVSLTDHNKSHHSDDLNANSNIPPIQKLLDLTQQDALSWLNSCLPLSDLFSTSQPSPPETQPYSYHQLHPSNIPIRTQPQSLLSLSPPSLTFPSSSLSSKPTPTPTYRRAIALSGTGNGDSFLRTTAARTVGSISRFSPLPPPQSPSSTTSPHPTLNLASSITAVSGPNGILQKSAEDRWATPSGAGEGEGGIIGIEVLYRDSHGGSHGGNLIYGHREKIESEFGYKSTHDKIQSQIQAKIAFDFNCSGMWRAYREEIDDHDGKGGPGYVDKVMVFREQYY